MEKKEYQKPAMTVVKLERQTPLLQASNLKVSRGNGYGTANSAIDESELTDGEWIWE